MTIDFIPKEDMFMIERPADHYYQIGRTYNILAFKGGVRIEIIARIVRAELLKGNGLLEDDKYIITLLKWPTCSGCGKQYEENENADKLCKRCYHLFETPEINEQEGCGS